MLLPKNQFVPRCCCILLKHSVFDRKVTMPPSQKVQSVFIPPKRKQVILLTEYICSTTVFVEKFRKPDVLGPQ